MSKKKRVINVFRRIFGIACIVIGSILAFPALMYVGAIYEILQSGAPFMEMLPAVAYFAGIILVWMIIPSILYLCAYFLMPGKRKKEKADSALMTVADLLINHMD